MTEVLTIVYLIYLFLSPLFFQINCQTEPYVFLVSNYAGQLYIESPTTSRIIVDNLPVYNAFDYVFEEKLIFFVTEHRLKHNVVLSVINATHLSTLKTHTVYTSNFRSLNALSIDWYNMMAYWADFKEKIIEVGEIQMPSLLITKHKILFSSDLDDLQSMIVDPISRAIYWLKSNSYTKIESAGLDGSHRTTVFYDPSSSGRDLSFDYLNQRLIWLDVDRQRISSIGLNGKELRYIRAPFESNTWQSSSMDILSDQVFISNETSIYCIKTGNSNLFNTQIQINLTYVPYSLRVFDAKKQPTPNTTNPINCVPNKFKPYTTDGETGCNYICLPSPLNTKYECSCPTGVPNAKPLHRNLPTLVKYNITNIYTCLEHPQKFLLIARPPDILMLSLQVPLLYSHLMSVGTSPRQNPVRVDFDPISKSIYWVDNAIYRLKLGETKPTIVIEPADGASQTLDGLAVDWVVGNLYWSSTGTNRQIWISRMDGAWPRPLLTLDGFDDDDDYCAEDNGNCNANNQQPHRTPKDGDPGTDDSGKRRPAALAVDPINRYLFFNVWSGTRGRVERTWLDGTHREVVVDQEHAAWPNGIALDIVACQLYYVDAYLAVINRVDYEGGKPTQIVSGSLQHPFGFDLMGDTLFWSDWQTLSLSQANKQDGGDLHVLKTLGVDDSMMGIRAVDLNIRHKYPTNICGDKAKSGCSHLCFMLPAAKVDVTLKATGRGVDGGSELYYCACPPDLALDGDGRTCIVPDSMLLYSLDGVGLRRMSLPKSPPRPVSYRQPPVGRNRPSSAEGLTARDIELAAAETAAVASEQFFNHVHLPNLQRVVRFDVHIAEERIYWVEDIAPQCISMAFLNGTGKETLICLFRDSGEETSQKNRSADPTPQDSIVGLALDWVTNTLYFCVDGEWPRLEVIDLKYRVYSTYGSSLPLPPGPSRGYDEGGLGKALPISGRTDWQPHLSRIRRTVQAIKRKRSVVPPWLLRSPPTKEEELSNLEPVGGAMNDYDYFHQSASYNQFSESMNNPVSMAVEKISDSVDNYRLVILHNLHSPRDLVVHPRKRLLFWLDGTHNTRFNIYSAGLDGKNRRLIWNGVGIVMSLALDYTTDRLYWLNWVSKCIESVSIIGDTWLAVNPRFPTQTFFPSRPPSNSFHSQSRTKMNGSDDATSSSTGSANDFHPYAIDVFQGAVLFSELTTQSVYRVQIPSSRSVQPVMSTLNLPAELLLRGRPSSHQHFLVLGLFVAGSDRQVPEPGHRCALWSQSSGPICQALCLSAQPFVPRQQSYPSAMLPFKKLRQFSANRPDDRSPEFTCACPTQFSLASDGYSCLEPKRSLLILTAHGSITRYTPDDHPATNLLSLSALSVPSHDQLAGGAASQGEWYNTPLDYGEQNFVERSTAAFAKDWVTRHRVVAAAMDELSNLGVFFLLHPRGVWQENSAPLSDVEEKRGRRGEFMSPGRSRRPGGYRDRYPLAPAFTRLAFLEFASGEVRLLEGGPLISVSDSKFENPPPLPDDLVKRNGNNSQSDRLLPEGRTESSSSEPTPSVLPLQSRPRFDMTFDPINQVVFWSDSHTGYIGAEDSRTGRSLGLVADLSEISRTVLEIVVEPRSGQLFQLTAAVLPHKDENVNNTGEKNYLKECRIEMTFLDGSDRRLIYDAGQLPSCPHSLAYSAKLTRLYWVDSTAGEIKAIRISPGKIDPSSLETVVTGAFPLPNTMVVVPESPTSGIWLMWFEPLHYHNPERQQSVRLFYAPISAKSTPHVKVYPLSPPGLHTKSWQTLSGLFPLPVRSGGLDNLSWHPCAGPSHGGCSHFCLPKSTASSPSLPLFPGPLIPPPLLASPLPAVLWRTARRCACVLGSHIVESVSSGGDETGCSRIPDCSPPNLICRAGLTMTINKGEAAKYLVSAPSISNSETNSLFPQRGDCLPAHRVCDGTIDCKDGNDEINCPVVCPEYVCTDGRCLPFSARCNGLIECDSDEACCSPDQFECRRPQSRSTLTANSRFENYRHTYDNPTQSSVWGRCLPTVFVCDGKADCQDRSDEAACKKESAKNSSSSHMYTTTIVPALTVNEFPSVYTVVIVSAIIVILLVLTLIGYVCSKRWSVFNSPYVVHADQLDMVLLPTTTSKGQVDGMLGEVKQLDGEEGVASGSMASPLITTASTTTAATSHQQQRNRKRHGGGGILFRHHYTVGVGGKASLSSSCVTVSPQAHHQASLASSVRWRTRQEGDCPTCHTPAVLIPCDNSHNHRCQKVKYARVPCRCGGVESMGSGTQINNSEYYPPSRCPPAPPPSSLPSPPPSQVGDSHFSLFGSAPNTPPPAPPPSKLHGNGSSTTSSTTQQHDCHQCYYENNRRPSHVRRRCPKESPEYRKHSRHRVKVSFHDSLKGGTSGKDVDNCPQCGSRQRTATNTKKRGRTALRSTTMAQCQYSYLECTLHHHNQSHPAGQPSTSFGGRASSFSPNYDSFQPPVRSLGKRMRRRGRSKPSKRSVTSPAVRVEDAVALSNLLYNLEGGKAQSASGAKTALALAASKTSVASVTTFGRRCEPLARFSTAAVERTAVTFKLETNSSYSSSSYQASSNSSSEYYPRETLNPPPSPITEATYATLPLTILKQPGITQHISLSASSGSSGQPNNELSSISFENLGNDRDNDQRIITTVENVGRSGVNFPYNHIYGTVGESSIFESLSKCVGEPGDQQLAKYQLSSSVVTDIQQPTTSSTTTTHIQNVHVVIVTSHDQNIEREQQTQNQQWLSRRKHLSSSEGSISIPSKGIRGCGHNAPLCESSGSCSSSDETLDRYHTSHCQCEQHRSITENVTTLLPNEEREQAEGAEDENPLARAPFAQLPGVSHKPSEKN